MITKGIVVSIPKDSDSNKYEVRLPFFEDATVDSEEMIYEATLSEAPGIIQGYAVGDVVYCAFEDNDNGRPVIVGKLFSQTIDNTGADIKTLDLEVTNKATLPSSTTIGDATEQDVANIKDIKNKVSKMGDTIFGSLTFGNTVQFTAGKRIYLVNNGEVIKNITSDDLFSAAAMDLSVKVNKSGDTMTGNLYFANTNNTSTSGSTPRGVYGAVANNDGWRIVGLGADNEGSLEIATNDDGNEPIYVRQYSGGGSTAGFVTIARTLTLLDGNGNTSIPGNIAAGGNITTTSENVLNFKGTVNTYNLITAKDAHDQNGAGVIFGGAGGFTIIGGGESATTAYNSAGVGASSEQMLITNDNAVQISTNLQNGWDNRRTFTFTTNGEMYINGTPSSWISARNYTVAYNNGNTSGNTTSFYPFAGGKSATGSWSIGTLSDNLYFSYTTDTNYSASNNAANSYYITSGGWFSGTANKADSVPASGVTGLIDKIYPVGSIYMSVNSTSPATLFGGTWEQLKDRFLLGAGNTYSNGATGGEATHTLTTNEMPAHSHTGKVHKTDGHYTGDVNETRTWSDPDTEVRITNSVGGGAAHNNMPPYLVVYMWKRTK